VEGPVAQLRQDRWGRPLPAKSERNSKELEAEEVI